MVVTTELEGMFAAEADGEVTGEPEGMGVDTLGELDELAELAEPSLGLGELEELAEPPSPGLGELEELAEPPPPGLGELEPPPGLEGDWEGD